MFTYIFEFVSRKRKMTGFGRPRVSDENTSNGVCLSIMNFRISLYI